MQIALVTRIAVLVSVGWIVAATIGRTFADLRVARFLRYSAFEVCDYVNYHLCHCGNCWRDLMAVAAFVDRPAIDFLIIALIPVAVAWAGAYAAVRAYRLVAGSTD